MPAKGMGEMQALKQPLKKSALAFRGHDGHAFILRGASGETTPPSLVRNPTEPGPDSVARRSAG
jgi:hypothetical protein